MYRFFVGAFPSHHTKFFSLCALRRLGGAARRSRGEPCPVEKSWIFLPAPGPCLLRR